jgi:hypothetical protein
MGLSLRSQTQTMRSLKETDSHTYHRTQQKLPAGQDTELWHRERLCVDHKPLRHLEGDAVKSIHVVRGGWRWLSRAGHTAWWQGECRIPRIRVSLRWPCFSPMWSLSLVPTVGMEKVKWPGREEMNENKSIHINRN